MGHQPQQEQAQLTIRNVYIITIETGAGFGLCLECVGGANYETERGFERTADRDPQLRAV